MAKIKIEEIQQSLDQGWKLISEEYTNLDSEMQFECPEGHAVYSTWKKMRVKQTCPLCEQNEFRMKDTKVIPKKKGVKRTLGLDQSTHVSGWAIFDNDQLTKYGKIEFSGESTERLFKIKQWFSSMISLWEPDIIGIEGIQFQPNAGDRMGVTVFEALARLQGVLLETAFELKVPIEICPTNTWRAHCGVKGRSRSDKKRSMQLLIKQWYDVSISDDEADAVGIAKFVANTHKPKREVEMHSWE